MDHNNHNTKSRTNKHLNGEERFYIAKQHQAGDSIRAIARSLGRSPSTISNELKRGTVEQIQQGRKVMSYLNEAGQSAYERSREASKKQYKLLKVSPFIEWVERKVLKDHWSFDAAVGYAITNHLFLPSQMVCTKTLYNYLRLGLINVKALDLPLLLKRSTKKLHTRKHKRALGRSIDERPASVDERTEFGHWELDSVRGIKDKEDDILLTLVERKSRLYVVLRCASAKADDVKETLKEWLLSVQSELPLHKVCRTITADNGREFASISELEALGIQVYYAHPYSAWERGSNERHNGLLRRCIPKGTPIKSVPESVLKRSVAWCNTLPRKILGYESPLNAFKRDLGL